MRNLVDKRRWHTRIRAIGSRTKRATMGRSTQAKSVPPLQKSAKVLVTHDRRVNRFALLAPIRNLPSSNQNRNWGTPYLFRPTSLSQSQHVHSRGEISRVSPNFL